MRRAKTGESNVSPDLWFWDLFWSGRFFAALGFSFGIPNTPIRSGTPWSRRKNPKKNPKRRRIAALQRKTQSNRSRRRGRRLRGVGRPRRVGVERPPLHEQRML